MNKLYPLKLLISFPYIKKPVPLYDKLKSTETPCHIIVLMAIE
jgi:hypothetical protein